MSGFCLWCVLEYMTIGNPNTGTTSQEGGDATKERMNGSGTDMGSGNRQNDTSGAVRTSEKADEGLENTE